MEVQPDIDFRAHAESMGAIARKVRSIAELESELEVARSAERTTVIVIETDALITTEAGGHWWDVAVPAVGDTARLRAAYTDYLKNAAEQRLVN